MRKEIFGWKEPFKAISFRPLRIEEKQRWCPLDTETVKNGARFLDLDFYGNKIFSNVGLYLRIRIDLSVQLGACRSRRSRIENQQRSLFRTSLDQSLIEILKPA
jgi:hypothetical protein